MKNKISLSTINVILGILVVLAPTLIFPVCSGDMIMDCMYTSKAEIGIGVVVIVLGLSSFFFSNKVRAGIAIANATLGALIIAVPTVLIGVCGSNMMTCNMATRPLLIITGGIILVTNFINSIYLLKLGE